MDLTGDPSARRFRQPAWLFILLGFALAPASIELPSMIVLSAIDGQPFLDLFDRDSVPVVVLGHAISLFFGVPIFLVLEWRRKRRLRHYFWSGLAVGGGVMLLLASAMLGAAGGGFAAGLIVVGGLCGMVVSAAFWWIVFGGSTRAGDQDVAAVFE